MIPDSIFDQLSSTPISQQMRDAANELGLRIVQGEFDDLDDTQRGDLQALAQMLEHWARRVLDLESAMLPPAAAERPYRAKS